VARRRRTGQRTARENIDDLCDAGTFTEYASLLVAGQRRRRSVEDLIERTPADGLVGGTGEIGGRRCVVAAYDYMVLAGTQGFQNHRKIDRLIELAHRHRLPFVLFAEGGGGRPGDTDHATVSGLELTTFAGFARLSGSVPVVAVVSGYCFAGNAAFAGCADVIIATEGASLGMGGPAMIAGGGLGVVAPGEVGPMGMQTRNGVVDGPVPQLCDTHGLPVVSLADTPGFMVGPAAERTATVRHVSRMFVAGANAAVPMVCVVLRKGYGLDVMAMAGGGFTEPVITVAWPSGEFAGWGWRARCGWVTAPSSTPCPTPVPASAATASWSTSSTSVARR
jgi:acetyl-CoA carboxylase carboxyltransferase component